MDKDFDSLWDPIDPAASETAYRTLLAETGPSDANDHTFAAELHALIARAESAQGKLAEAHASLAAAKSLLDDERSSHKAAARIRYLLERGRLHILEKTPSQARILFSEAWTLALNSGEDYLLIDIAQVMAAIEAPKAKQAWILRAIEIAERSPLPKAKRWLGSLYASLGWMLYDLRQYEKSLATFQKSLSHLKAQGTEREIFVARWSAGKVLRTLGRTEEALTLQKTLLAELGGDERRDGRLYEELAECLHALERTAEAQLYFELAYREFSNDEWINDNQPLKLKRMKDLGKVR